MEFSQIFYNYAVGIGVLLAGLGGLRIFNDWLRNARENAREEKRKKKLTAEFKAKYPKEENGKAFRLIKSTTSAKPRHVYLLDNDTKIKHWIASSVTFKALKYEPYMVDDLKPDEFNSFEEGDKILIE